MERTIGRSAPAMITGSAQGALPRFTLWVAIVAQAVLAPVTLGAVAVLREYYNVPAFGWAVTAMGLFWSLAVIALIAIARRCRLATPLIPAANAACCSAWSCSVLALPDGLASDVGGWPRVAVHLSGDLDGLSPGVGAALYRIAQEAVTNALRHARNVTRVTVEVGGEGDRVRLTVHDDGGTATTHPPTPGFGLLGMSERTALLGGTMQAGPAHGGLDRPGDPAQGPRDGTDPSHAAILVTAPIRVLIADDLRAVARGLRPDVCLFDIHMPHLDGGSSSVGDAERYCGRDGCRARGGPCGCDERCEERKEHDEGEPSPRHDERHAAVAERV